MIEYGEKIAPDAIQFSVVLPVSPEQAWQYIVDSEARGKWLATGEFEERTGGAIELKFHHADLSPLPDDMPDGYPEHVTFTGTVTACEPINVFAHTWEFGDENTEVRFELKARNNHTELVLTHIRLDTGDSMVTVGAGWHTHLEILLDVLQQREPQPFWKRFGVLVGEYAERVPATA